MKKIGLICLALVLALGALGAAYAMWDKTLDIDATVNTGEVNMEILSVSSDDPAGTIDRGKDKDVGWTEVSIDGQTMIATIHNAYPCYEVYLHFTGHNNGTVPVKLQAINITAPPEITVTAWDGIGEQVEPCQNCDNSALVHVEQEADELATYTFTVEFYYVQWNEYEAP